MKLANQGFKADVVNLHCTVYNIVVIFIFLMVNCYCVCTMFFSNSLIIDQVQTKEIMTVIVFGYLILISIDFYKFISQFSLKFWF